jgi:hypothetical protein
MVFIKFPNLWVDDVMFSGRSHMALLYCEKKGFVKIAIRAAAVVVICQWGGKSGVKKRACVALLIPLALIRAASRCVQLGNKHWQ